MKIKTTEQLENEFRKRGALVEIRGLFMEYGAECEQCGKFIKDGNQYFRFKNDFDKAFCDISCIQHYVLKNAEIREGKLSRW